MNREAYETYVRAFNAKDYDAVCDFYVQPPTMSFFGVNIQSREALKAFYGFLHSYVHESVTINRFASSDELTSVDAIVRIEAHRDLDREALDAHGCTGFFPIKKGEVQEIRQFLFYTITNGKIAKVEAAIPFAD